MSDGRPASETPIGDGAVRTETVADDDDAIRIDRWFKRHYPSLSHARLEKLLRTG
jgi:23S rRNA pseudouridine955/2504/2580 synthase